MRSSAANDEAFWTQSSNTRWLSSILKLDATTDVADPFIRLSNLRFNCIFEI
jgi:hypothetical protein